MLVSLFVVTFLVALLASLGVVALFSRSIGKLLLRLVSDQLAPAWKRYILFAILVVGVSGGVRVGELERYLTPDKDGKMLVLTSARWFLEIYKTIIGSLESVAWMLMIFFVFALLAYVVVRGLEGRQAANESRAGGSAIPSPR